MLGSRIEEGSELLIASRGCSNRSLTLDVVRPLPSRATRGTSHGLPCGLDVTSFCFCTWRFRERDNYSSFDDLDGDRDALLRSPLCFTMAATQCLQTRRERVSLWVITSTFSEPSFVITTDTVCLFLAFKLILLALQCALHDATPTAIYLLAHGRAWDIARHTVSTHDGPGNETSLKATCSR